ncbi:MAG TPA: hypothetical protein VHE81_10910 [Lacipirellulaceae bacterium]|nr:hypothetical protein [Lacipirellulaceae bacterium]
MPAIVIVDIGLYLARHWPLGVDARAVLDLLHRQRHREFASDWIELLQDRRRQKDFPTGKPFAGIDDQPTNQPTGIVK